MSAKIDINMRRDPNPNNELNDEVVCIESSDDEHCNNNNEERSPCKNRHEEIDEMEADDPAEKADESDDEVIFVGDDTMELESISKIETQGELVMSRK